MSANFYAAILSFSVTAMVALIAAGRRRQEVSAATAARAASRIPVSFKLPTLVWGLVVAGSCLLLNVLFR